MNQTHSLIIQLAVPAALPGCVTVTKMKDEARTKVRFATTRAARDFYEAALLPQGPNQNGHGTVCIGVGNPHVARTRETGNVLFNRAIQSADADRNGLISESEAGQFAGAQPETDLLMSH